MRALVVILLFVSFSAYTQTKEDFSGSWYRCQLDGTYEELHIQENYFRSAFGDAEFMMADRTFYYELHEDSIRYCFAPLNLQTEHPVHFGKVKLLDKAILLFSTKNNSDTLYQLNMTFKPQPKSKELDSARKWYREFEEGFVVRAKKAGCIDRRPLSERKKDEVNIDLNIVTDDLEDIIYYHDSTDHND